MPSRLLVVDDDPAMLQALSGMVELRLEDVVIDVAHSGSAALNHIRETDYDAIVSDVKMPGMDGFQLMEQILKMRPTTPTLLVTGHGDHDMGVRALNAGAYAFIPKPIDRDFFIAWLKRAIQLRQLSRAVEQQNQMLERTVQERTAKLEGINRELKETLERERESEERFRSIFQHSNDAIFVIDPAQRRILEANERATAMLEYSRQELLGCSIEDVHPNEMPKLIEFAQSVLQSGSGWTDELTCRTKTGRCLPVEISASTIDIAGRACLLAIVRDITERKRAEATLRESEAYFHELAEKMPQVVWTNLPDGQVDWVNHQWLDYTGQTLEYVLTYPEAWMAALHPEDRAHAERSYMHGARSGLGFTMEARFRRASDGAYRWYLNRSLPVRDAAGNVVKFLGTCTDIDDLKQAEEARRASDERFRAIVDQATAGIAQTDLTGLFALVNDRYCEITGYSRKDLLKTRMQDIIHPDDVPRHLESFHRLLTEGTPFVIEKRYVRKDGSLVWVSNTVSVTRDASGRPQHVVVVTLDITHRREAEDALARLTAASEQQRRLYETILSNTPDLVYVFGLDHRFAYANEALLAMWGRTWDEAIGRNCLELGYEPWHAALHDRELEQVITTKQPIRGEVPFTGTQGRRIYDYIFVPVLDVNGEVEAVAGTTRDVTERKQTEEKLRDTQARLDATLSAAEIATWTWDIENDRVVADKNSARLFSVTPEEAAGGPIASYVRAMHPEDRPRVETAIAEALQDGRYEMEYRLVQPDGASRWVVARGNVEYDAGGKPIRFPGVIIDITERKKAEEALRESRATLEFTLESAQVGDWDLDVIHDTSRRSLRHDHCFGYTEPIPESEWGFDTFIRHVHPEDRPRIERQFREAVSELKAWRFECRVVWADGSVHWIAAHGSIYCTVAGKPTRMLGIVADITERKQAEQEMVALLARERDARAEAETLHEISRTLAAELDLPTLLQRVTDAGTALAGAAFGAFFYNAINEQGESYVLYTLTGAPREAFAKFGLPRNTPLFEATFRGTTVVRIDDVLQDPRYGHNPPHRGMPQGHLPVRSYLAVPVLSRSGEVIGGIFFGHPQPGVFTERTERLSTGIAAQAAIAIDNARLYERANRTAEQLHARARLATLRADISAALAQDENARAILQRCAEFLVRHLDVAFARIWSLDAAARVLELQASAGLYTHLDGPHSRINVGELKIGRIAQSRQPLLTNDVVHDPNISDPDWARREGMIAFAGFPLMVENRAVGVVAMFARHALPDTVLNELRYLSDGFAQFIKRKRAEEDIRRLLSEAEQRERALRDKQDQLVQAAKLASLGEMAGGIAHEINNPLNNIGLYVANVVDHLQAGLPTRDNSMRQLQAALTQIAKAATIINHLRTFARAASTPYEPVAVNAVLQSALSLTEAQLRLHNIDVTMEPSPHDPSVTGNAIQLEQVVINLITNAKDAVEGSPLKRISIHCAVRGPQVRIAVADTGPGIPPHLQAQIFDPFFTTKEVGKGTGLGLSISYGIIKEHQGEIEVESEPGKGTTFVVRLPLGGGTSWQAI